GRYPVGWPRMRRGFTPGTVALDEYDFFTFRTRIDSDRDEVADDVTPFIVNFSGHGGGKHDVFLDLGDVQRTWKPFRISIREVMESTSGGSAALRDLAGIQLVIAEGNYADRTQLQFDFDDLSLVRLTRPVLDRILCSTGVLVPARHLPVALSFLGATAAEQMGCRIQTDHVRKVGSIQSYGEVPLSSASGFLVDLTGVTSGSYQLVVRLVDRDGQVQSERNQSITAVDGYGLP
ncbi:MAG: hypothetical protein U1E27_10165, partial [Kiritimatiellia bacterium]|nr:hypothetical protein [Kiritimatiellia bacterium]